MILTVEEWFNLVKDNVIKEKLLNNLVILNKTRKADCIYVAIDKGFSWSETPEGHGYWNTLFNNLMHDEEFKGNFVYTLEEYQVINSLKIFDQFVDNYEIQNRR